MRIKILPGALVIAALVTLAISLGVATPNVYGGGDDTLPTLPEKPELKYPNLGSNLDQLVASVEEGETSAKEAAEDAPVHREASVAVTIYLSGNVDDVVKFLEDNGGSPRNVGEDYIEAYVPVSLLGQVSERTGVIRVREIVPPEAAQIAQQVAGHGPPVHGASAWNQAGFGGQGVKVGVIDAEFGFNDFRGLMGTELPSTVQARCYTSPGKFTRFLAGCENSILGSDHGTLLAEAVMDIAPEASLYIAAQWSLGDLRTATDWMVSQGVSVIVHGVTYEYDGPGDGTSPFSNSSLKTVDRAVSGGIVWVNAAGNQGQSTWFGNYSIVNVNGNKYVAFNGSDVFNDMTLEAWDWITVQLRWEDSWSAANRDFDLLIWDFATSTIVDHCFDPQQGRVGQVPFESLSYLVPNDGRYAVVVAHEGGSTPEWIQLTAWGVDSIEHHTESGSIANPAESSNAGMLAVGAAHWSNVGSIEPYSSRGPTPDGRVKPDIVGADCGATALLSLNQNQDGFCGTSQSAAHVAGMAALVRQRFPTYTAVQVANYLKEHAEQRESPDPNNTWGHGFAQLPSLSECSDAVPSAASNPGLVADCEALLAARDTLAGSGTLNWSGSTAIAAWDDVTLSGSPLRVTSLVLSDSQLTGTIPPELGNLNNLEGLYLNNNQLTGEIPAELGSLTNLKYLWLFNNQLTGEIPAELGSLAGLEGLSLSINQLTGEIPAELGGLSNLVVLFLNNNQLTGEIPAELGSLTNLDGLYLDINQLTGGIPAELGSLTNLVRLRLEGNQLTGGIPAELGSLSNLDGLQLDDNRLTGGIPAELGSLTNLKYLDLSDNLLTGEIPAELGSLTNLKWLYLDSNQLIGCIPGGLRDVPLNDLAQLGLDYCMPAASAGDAATDRAALVTLYNATDGANWANNDNWLSNAPMGEWRGVTTDSDGRVTRLDLPYNQLTGGIPVELGDLTYLRWLALAGNQLTGEIPAELGSLTSLEGLYLNDNQLTGGIPAELGSLTNLTHLDLRHNQLTGEIPAELGSLTNLEGLRLNGNQLTGEIPAELGSLTSLEGLRLNDNQLTGGIPAELGSLSNLDGLQLDDNRLTGGIPAELGSLTNLKYLDLSDNLLTGEILSELGDLSSLTELSLYSNQLTGEIPAELASLTNLEVLWLSNNQLTGEIPGELGGITNLKYLDLSNNQLTGEIPAELGNLTNLEQLWLFNNQLTGEIPGELGSLTNLKYLDLSFNQLTGEILSELGDLTRLTELSLHHNQLTGEIPAWLGSLTNLKYLDLSNNQLTGEIPAELGSLTSLEVLYLDSNQLTGCIPEGLRDVAYNDFNQLGLPFCAGASGAPTIGTLTPGADFLTITWAAPTGSTESAIITYDLRYIETAASGNSDADWTIVEDVWTTGSGALSYQIAGLTDGTQYDVQVRAVSAAGDGPWSATAQGTPATWGAIRSFSPPSVAPAGEVVVMITASGYGRFGAVTETLPPGFSYVSSSLEDSGVTDVGREVSFSLFGQTAFTYTVTAPSAEGTYSFSGVLRNSDREDVPVGGALTIAVAAGDPLIVRYDANGNGMIEKNEVIAAINDYLFGEGDAAISKSDVIKLINLYLFG